ncbi:Protein F14 (1), partial [Monkeypox virus]
MKHRLYSEGLS